VECKIKGDCFAYNKKAVNCKALDDLICRKGDCVFYKNKNQLEYERNRSINRIKSLPQELNNYITLKYFVPKGKHNI
jgi:hypothetical protein